MHCHFAKYYCENKKKYVGTLTNTYVLIVKFSFYVLCWVFFFTDIKGNTNLHEVLYLVLLAGNYLNAVSCNTNISVDHFTVNSSASKVKPPSTKCFYIYSGELILF